MSRLNRAPEVSPLLAPSVPVGAATPDVQERARQAYEAGGVPLPAALQPASAAPEPEKPERTKKIGGWNGRPSVLKRIRNAWWHTHTKPGGYPSMSKMIESVLLAWAVEQEREHNNGEPFSDVPDGMVKHSRTDR